MKELYLTEEKNGISDAQLDEMLRNLLNQWPDIHKVLRYHHAEDLSNDR